MGINLGTPNTRVLGSDSVSILNGSNHYLPIEGISYRFEMVSKTDHSFIPTILPCDLYACNDDVDRYHVHTSLLCFVMCKIVY